MIILLAIVFAVGKGLLAFAVGAGLALTLWLVSIVIQFSIPSLLRWGVGAGASAICGYAMISYRDRLPLNEAEAAYAQYAFWSDVICVSVAVLAIASIGLIVALTRTAISLGTRGLKAASGTTTNTRS